MADTCQCANVPIGTTTANKPPYDVMLVSTPLGSSGMLYTGAADTTGIGNGETSANVAVGNTPMLVFTCASQVHTRVRSAMSFIQNPKRLRKRTARVRRR